MKIGVIGSGMIGGTLGQHFVKAGHEVMFSSRNPEKLKDAIKNMNNNNVSYGFPEDAAQFANVILLAIPHGKVPGVSKRIGNVDKKIIIDATNYYPKRDGIEIGKEAAQ